MIPQNVVDESIRQLSAAIAKGAGKNELEPMMKAQTTGWTVATGLVWYDLQTVAKRFDPENPPWRTYVPRQMGEGGTATNWKAITKVNADGRSPGIQEGRRNAVNAVETKSYTAPYAVLGHDSSLTFEAQEAAINFDDIRLRAATALLSSVKISEDAALLGGNRTVALGTTGTPSLSDVATGGSLVFNTEYRIRALALTPEGLRLCTLSNGGVATATDELREKVTRTNADGTTTVEQGYNGQISANAAITTDNDALSTHSIRASVANKVGAFAYAWFVDDGAAGDLTLYGVSTVNSILITDAPGLGVQTSADASWASDTSLDQYLMDGMLELIEGVGPQTDPVVTQSGAAVNVLPTGTPGTGTRLTSDGANGCAEINAILKQFWTGTPATGRLLLSPDAIWVSYQQLLDLTQVCAGTGVGGGGSSQFRFMVDPTALDKLASGAIAGGLLVGQYVNPFVRKVIPVILHPTLPNGTIMFTTKKLPYELPTMDPVLAVRTRREMYSLEFPIVTRQFTSGVYVSETLVCGFPPAFGIIKNIASSN